MTKFVTSRGVALGLAATVAAFSLVPAVQAHDRGPGRMAERHDDSRDHRGQRDGMDMRGHGGRAGQTMMLGFSCAPRAAEALEIGLVRLSYRLDLTDTQQPLFDALKTSALSAQNTVAEACDQARPERAAGTQPTAPDLVDTLRDRVAIESARVAAMEAVLPDLEALVGSLTSEQLASMAPRARTGEMRMERGRGFGGGRLEQAPAMPAAPTPPAPRG